MVEHTRKEFMIKKGSQVLISITVITVMLNDIPMFHTNTAGRIEMEMVKSTHDIIGNLIKGDNVNCGVI